VSTGEDLGLGEGMSLVGQGGFEPPTT
jgi:hypothetical protein